MASIKCILGFHNYEVLKEIPLNNTWGKEIGVVVVNRCKHCGKIQNNNVYTIEPR